MARRTRRAGTPALRVLTEASVAFTEHPYQHDPDHPSYGLEAAEALGVDPHVVFKTLLADVNGTLVVAVLPVTCSLNLKALAATVGGKRASLADPTEAERATGYVVGGISPMGQRTALTTVVDDSALALGRMYVSGGRRGLDVALLPADLIRLTRAQTAPICAQAR